MTKSEFNSGRNKTSAVLAQSVFFGVVAMLLLAPWLAPHSIVKTTYAKEQEPTQVVSFEEPVSFKPEPPTSDVVTPVSTTPVPVRPTRIVIPSIGVDAPVISVGRTDDGRMGVPGDLDTVAWYWPGFKPGEVGHAVLAGHLDNAIALPGVFKDLSELGKGDEIQIVGEKGKKLVFRVTGTYSYEYGQAPTRKIFGASEKVSISLITCGGKWVQAMKNYSDRTVVYGEFVKTLG